MTKEVRLLLARAKGILGVAGKAANLTQEQHSELYRIEQALIQEIPNANADVKVDFAVAFRECTEDWGDKYSDWRPVEDFFWGE